MPLYACEFKDFRTRRGAGVAGRLSCEAAQAASAEAGYAGSQELATSYKCLRRHTELGCGFVNHRLRVRVLPHWLHFRIKELPIIKGDSDHHRFSLFGHSADSWRHEVAKATGLRMLGEAGTIGGG